MYTKFLRRIVLVLENSRNGHCSAGGTNTGGTGHCS